MLLKQQRYIDDQ